MRKLLLVSFVIVSCDVSVGIELSSDAPIEYSDLTGELIARGRAKININDVSINADEIRFQKEQSLVSASGEVRVDGEKLYVLADDICYYIEKNLLHVDKGKVKVRNYYISVDTFDYVDGNKFGSNARIFPVKSEDDCFAPSLNVKNFEIQKNKFLFARGAGIKVGRMPIIFLPRASVKLSNRPFFVRPYVGMTRGNGPFWQNDFYFGIQQNWQVGGLLDVYKRRGVLVGPAIKFKSEEQNIVANAYLAFIRDNASEKIRGYDINRRQIAKDRYFGRFDYKQHYGDALDITSDVTLLSDSDAVRDFRKSWQENDQRPETFLEAAYRGQNYIISVFGRFEPNNFYPTLKRLPDARIDYLPSRLFDGHIMHHGHISLSHLRGTDKATDSKGSSCRADLYYGWSIPMVCDNFVTVKPVIGTRLLSYRVPGDDCHSKGLVQGGIDINVKFTGQSEYSNAAFDVNGLRHTIDAVIQYRVMPTGNSIHGISRLSTDVFSTEMPSIDLDDMRNADTLKRQNMMRLGIKNNLYTKSDSCLPRKLVRFDVFQDVMLARNSFDYNNEIRQKKFPDTYILAGAYPVSWLSCDVYGRIDPSRFRLSELKTSTAIKDGDFWQLSFITKYSNLPRVVTKQYGLKFSFNLSSRTAFAIEGIYDARIKSFSEQKFSLSTVLGNCWSIGLDVTKRHNVKREERLQFGWHIDLLDF